VDTEQDHATPRDSAWLADGDTGSSLTGPIGGYHRGRVWSSWVQPSAGRVAIQFTSDAANCCPDGSGGIDCSCGQAPNFPYKGVTTESHEYQRYQTGTVPFWTPVRFPGQYFDAEMDLVENWNRYYNPSIGRYSQPEPLLRQPRYIAAMALRSHSVPSYSYALHNPIRFFDRNGLWAAGISLDVDLIFPLLSGGGGSFGINLVYTSENGLGLFVYHPSKGSFGRLFGWAEPAGLRWSR